MQLYTDLLLGAHIPTICNKFMIILLKEKTLKIHLTASL